MSHTLSLSTRWFWCFSRFHSVILLNFEREHKLFVRFSRVFFSFCRVCIAFEGFFSCMPFNLSFSFRNKYFLFLFFDCKGISKFSIITLFSKTKWEANERWGVISFAKTQRKTNRDKWIVIMYDFITCFIIFFLWFLGRGCFCCRFPHTLFFLGIDFFTHLDRVVEFSMFSILFAQILF